jgi:TolB-like protein
MRLHRFLTIAALAAVAGTSRAQTTPTVAVLYFNNGALGKANDELAPLTKGIADLFIQELSANPAVRVVERDQIQKVLEEQRLSQGGAVDNATIVKIGKLVGAHHMIAGGFQTDPKGTTLNVTLRVFNTETSEIEFVTDGKDKPENLFALVSRVAAKVNKGLKLPELPKQVGDARSAQADKVPYQAVMLYSRALNAKDAGRKGEAVALFRQTLDKFPEYEPAKRELAKLGS